ncbi:tryptophan-rich sensory protein [Candidatus Saccharibacteria bacterium]|nr:tryptophan-rich sensory protein [Candidatus Saccharibacteria bacterium]
MTTKKSVAAKNKNSKNSKNSKGSGAKTIKVTVNKKGEMKKWQKVLLCIGLILLPIVLGSIITLFTIDAQEAFSKFEQPPLAPPAWLFPVAWTILYALMGLASYFFIVYKPKNDGEKILKRAEIVIYFVQLAVNLVWTLIFFNLDAKYFAFGWLVAMWLMIVALVVMACKNSKPAMWCLIPYLLWTTFAGYLNIMIAVLN